MLHSQKKQLSLFSSISFLIYAISKILDHKKSESELIQTLRDNQLPPVLTLNFLSISSLRTLIQFQVFKGNLNFHQSSSSIQLD